MITYSFGKENFDIKLCRITANTLELIVEKDTAIAISNTVFPVFDDSDKFSFIEKRYPFNSTSSVANTMGKLFLAPYSKESSETIKQRLKGYYWQFTFNTTGYECCQSIDTFGQWVIRFTIEYTQYVNTYDRNQASEGSILSSQTWCFNRMATIIAEEVYNEAKYNIVEPIDNSHLSCCVIL